MAKAREDGFQAAKTNLQSDPKRRQAFSSQTPGTGDKVVVRKDDCGQTGDSAEPREEDGWGGWRYGAQALRKTTIGQTASGQERGKGKTDPSGLDTQTRTRRKEAAGNTHNA